ncbi:MAG TPA: ABC transporter permease [Pyrinomonadaceae bacterium]|jgi:putative ABC transport system permease protein
MRGLKSLEMLWQDLRFGTRMLWKNPGFTAVSVLTLALGIGANSAIFSIVNAALLEPLPYPNSEGLVMVWGNFQRLNMNRLGVSAPEFFDYKSQNDVFSEVAAYQPLTFNLTQSDEPERISGARVSATLFTLLGTQPLAGRTLLEEEERPDRSRVAVLSQRLWQRRFNSDRALIGKSVALDGESYTVVGIMPQGFRFPLSEPYDTERSDVWVPIAFTPQELSDRGRYSFRMIARLRPGASLAQARAEMNTIGQRLEQEYPRTYRGPKGEDGGWHVTVTTLREEVVGNARVFLLILLGVVGFVLLIACANIANLWLARASTRRREVAIRTALGAGRARLVRQFLTESVMLALLGGGAGLLLAMWGVELLSAASPRGIPRLDEADLDIRVLGFTLGVSLLTGLLFGLVPALQSSRVELSESIKENSRSATTGYGWRRLRGLLVVSEVALALVLLIGAGLLLKSFGRLLAVDPGFNAENVLTMRMSLPPSRYTGPQERVNFYGQLLEGVKALPGVEAASITTALPLSGVNFGGPFSIEGRPLDMSGKPPHAYVRTVAPDYFKVMGIAFIKGRDFGAVDTDKSQPVVIINEAFARGFFNNGEAIGQRIKIGAPGSPRPWMLVAGVVRDVKSDGLDAEATPEMYMPYSQDIVSAMTLVIRTRSDPASSVAAVRHALQAVDKDQPVYNIRTMEQLLGESVAQRRLNMLMLGAFALLALLLATTGIFALMAYTVAQRTREIGIRMALGAQKSDILKLVFRQAMSLTVLGLCLGLAAAFALTRLMTSMLFGVSATDPQTFIGIALLLTVVSLVACYIPARRAMKVDPTIALRYE